MDRQSLPEIDNSLWKEIPGWEGLYSAHPMGLVRSEDRFEGYLRKGRVLKPRLHSNKYHTYTFWVKGMGKNIFAHRIMLETFVGPCPPKKQGCHLDGDKHNNAIDNLRWDTSANNHKDRKAHGTCGTGVSRPNFKTFNKDDVLLIRRKYDAGEGISSIARSMGRRRTSVADVARRRTWEGIENDKT